MIITCPSCETHFSVPDAAIGPKGRRLRCARCSHAWHVDPPHFDDEVPLQMAPAKQAPKPAPQPQPEDDEPRAPRFEIRDDHDSFDLDDGLEDDKTDDGVGKAEQGDPFAHIADMMMKSAPEPIPDMFASQASKPAPKRRGAFGLWLLFIILLIGASAIGLYLFQDAVIERYPALARTYDDLGIRNKVVGAGLAFRNIDSERIMQNDSEVLIVRGVIANTTDRARDIPALRLALYNNERSLQEKIIQPPQTMLDAKASVGFRVTLDRPDADATRFEVTFSPPAEQPSGH